MNMTKVPIVIVRDGRPGSYCRHYALK